MEVDARGRCKHWHGPTDILAIRFPCCDLHYACHDCHATLADHPAERWARKDFDRPALLCGACGNELTVTQYLAAPERCSACRADFNPRCILHHRLYFDVLS